MFELSREEYRRVLPMFSEIRQKAVFAYSVLEHRQGGQVYVNDKTNPTSVFLTSCGGFYCAVGAASDLEFNEEIARFLNGESNFRLANKLGFRVSEEHPMYWYNH